MRRAMFMMPSVHLQLCTKPADSSHRWQLAPCRADVGGHCCGLTHGVCSGQVHRHLSEHLVGTHFGPKGRMQGTMHID